MINQEEEEESDAKYEQNHNGFSENETIEAKPRIFDFNSHWNIKILRYVDCYFYSISIFTTNIDNSDQVSLKRVSGTRHHGVEGRTKEHLQHALAPCIRAAPTVSE